jgi:hypothetical protein
MEAPYSNKVILYESSTLVCCSEILLRRSGPWPAGNAAADGSGGGGEGAVLLRGMKADRQDIPGAE